MVAVLRGSGKLVAFLVAALGEQRGKIVQIVQTFAGLQGFAPPVQRGTAFIVSASVGSDTHSATGVSSVCRAVLIRYTSKRCSSTSALLSDIRVWDYPNKQSPPGLCRAAIFGSCSHAPYACCVTESFFYLRKMRSVTLSKPFSVVSIGIPCILQKRIWKTACRKAFEALKP